MPINTYNQEHYLNNNKLISISFDEEFARISGVRVDLYNTVFLFMVALTVVLLVQVVGIILVVALLALPAAAAGQLSKRLPTMMLLAVLLSLVSTTGGLLVSYSPDLPAGATIVLIAGIIYLISTLYVNIRHQRDAP